MLDPAIAAFFNARKEAWLKAKSKSSMTEDQLKELKIQCDEQFSLENWLPNASKRAGQISMSTHPCTFSHPSARKNKNGYVTSVICHRPRCADGYLRTGNLDVPTDALGNAAALDVYKFLTIETADHQTVIEHVQHESHLARALLDIPTMDYQTLRDGFLQMTQQGEEAVTSSKIKQVYFPVDDDYHLLSLLTNSGIVFELRHRLDEIRFSEETKLLRDKRRKGEASDQEYREIYHLTTIGYGGTKPQNISVLNNQHGGKAHLLLCEPPKTTPSQLRFPKHDFFKESLYLRELPAQFKKFHHVLLMDSDSAIPRQKQVIALENSVNHIVETLIEQMALIRSVAKSQYQITLSGAQKIWLALPQAKREQTQGAWLDEIITQISRWIVNRYRHDWKQKAIPLADAEMQRLIGIISDYREVLQ